MKVSICIPTYNQVQYIRGALESALGQTLRDLEVVVSDNHSTDGTREYLESVRDPRLRVVRPERHVSANENFEFCSAAARGEYLSILCSDDLVRPAYAETMASILDAHPNVVFAYSAIEWIDENGNTKGVERHIGGSFLHTGTEELKRFFKGAGCNFPTILIRRSAYESVGGFSRGSILPDAVCILDWDLELRLLDVGDIYYHDEVLGYFRVWSTPERDTRIVKFMEESAFAYETRIADIVRRRPELASAARKARIAKAMAFANGMGKLTDSPEFERGCRFVLAHADTRTVRFVLWLHRRRLSSFIVLRDAVRSRLRQFVKGLLYRTSYAAGARQ